MVVCWQAPQPQHAPPPQQAQLRPASSAGRPLGVQPAQSQPAQPRFSSGGGQALGSGGSAHSRLLGNTTGTAGGRPLSAAGRPATASAAARPDIDASILAVQISEIDGMLAAVVDAPPEVLEPALELLAKMYTAIIDKPNEPKVRRIRWMNAKVQQHLSGVPVAQDFLLASGFYIIQSPVEDSVTGENEEVVVFQEGSSFTLLAEARSRLNRALSLSRATPRSSSAVAAQPRPMSTTSDLSAGDSPMSPASPGRSSAGLRQTQLHSAADFGVPGSDPSSSGTPTGAPPPGWETFDSQEGQLAAGGQDDWAMGDVDRESAVGAGGCVGGQMDQDTSGGAGRSEAGAMTDTERMQQMDALACSMRGAEKERLIPALELMVKIASAILEKSADEKVVACPETPNTHAHAQAYTHERADILTISLYTQYL